MDLKLVITMVLSLIPLCVCTHHLCYDEHQLEQMAQKKLRNRFPLPQEPGASKQSEGCPLELYKSFLGSSALEKRSLSPWRYVVVNMTNHYPSSYTRAECLCKGCITFQNQEVVETHNYNSAVVPQERVFLERVSCPGQGKYKLVPKSIEVPVACTCVVPETK